MKKHLPVTIINLLPLFSETNGMGQMGHARNYVDDEKGHFSRPMLALLLHLDEAT